MTRDDNNNNNNDEEGQVIILDSKRNKVIEFVFEQGGKEGSRRIYIDEKCRWYCIAASLKDAKEVGVNSINILIWAENYCWKFSLN